MSKSPQEVFKYLKIPFLSDRAQREGGHHESSYRLLKKWLSYYEERVKKFHLSSYKKLETENNLPKLKEVIRSIINEHQNPSPKMLASVANYSPKVVRQTAMRILFDVIQQSPMETLSDMLVNEELPSPIGASIIAHLTPKIAYEDSPISNKILTPQKSYRTFLSMLSPSEIPLLSLYYHRPDLLDFYFPKAQFSKAITESKIALALSTSDIVRSHLIYGKWDEKWIYGFYKRLYSEQHGLLGAMAAIAGAESNSPSALAFNLMRKDFRLKWNLSDFTEGISFQKYLQSSLAPKLSNELSSLHISQQVTALLSASDYQFKEFYQCSNCFTLYSAPATENLFTSKHDCCTVCSGFQRVFSHFLKNNKVSSDEERLLLKEMLLRISNKDSPRNFRKFSFEDILTSLDLFESIHKQSWGAYKKLAFQILDEGKRSVLLTNFFDNLFTYKHQVYFPYQTYFESKNYTKSFLSIEEKLKKGHYFLNYSPWARCFLNPKPKSAKEWVQAFLSYITFPFPPSSLFYYKTFGDLDAHLQSQWRGAYICSDHETYLRGTSQWNESIFRSSDAHLCNPFYQEKIEEKNPPKPLSSYLKSDFIGSTELHDLSSCLDKYQRIPKNAIEDRLHSLGELSGICGKALKEKKGSFHLEEIAKSIQYEQSILSRKKSP